MGMFLISYSFGYNQKKYTEELDIDIGTEKNNDLSTAKFFLHSHRIYEDKEYLSGENKEVFLRDFGLDGLNFDGYEGKVSGVIIYPILSTDILSDVQYQFDNKKSLHIYISTRKTKAVDHTKIASYRELIYITLNNIKSKPDSVFVYLNEKPMLTKGGIHTTVTW